MCRRGDGGNQGLSVALDKIMMLVLFVSGSCCLISHSNEFIALDDPSSFLVYHS
jgi:hypothetical protein